MDNGKRPEKPIGFTPSIRTAKGNVSAQVKSTGVKKASPVLKIAPIPDALPITSEELTAAKILALQVILGDFRALKLEMSKSWQASSNGKIYWCAEIPGHKLAIIDGKLLVDHEPVEKILARLVGA